MAKKVVGLDVDYSGIKGAEMVRRGRSRVVTALKTVPLPGGTVAGGKLEDSEALINGLKNLFRAENFSTKSVSLGIRGDWVTVKTHRLPKMSGRELEKALEFEVPELVSFPVDSPRDISFDYFINSEADNELEIVLVACPRKFIYPYIHALRAVGLTLEAIDVAALGWSGLVGVENRTAFAEISEEQTTVQVNLNGKFKVLRVVPVGGALHFREGVREAFQCLPEHAKQLSARHDIDYLLTEGGTGSKRVIRAVVQQFVGSILQTLDFIRAQERATTFRSILDELILVGDLADLPGIGDMLAKEIDLPVRSLQQLESLEIGFERSGLNRLSSFGSALALGLRGGLTDEDQSFA